MIHDDLYEIRRLAERIAKEAPDIHPVTYQPLSIRDNANQIQQLCRSIEAQLRKIGAGTEPSGSAPV